MYNYTKAHKKTELVTDRFQSKLTINKSSTFVKKK